MKIVSSLPQHRRRRRRHLICNTTAAVLLAVSCSNQAAVHAFSSSITTTEHLNNNNRQQQHYSKATNNKRLFHHQQQQQRFYSTNLAAAAATTMTVEPVPGRPTWQQTMLRIKDPKKSIAFYESLGFTLIDSFDFPQWTFSLYFMTTLPHGTTTYDLKPGTQAAHDYLWSMDNGVCLELTHNHGTENDDTVKYHPGNAEKDGFGHVAVNVNNVNAMTEKLLQAGCTFKKKPNEGRMPGIAFVYDPDGYWVELCGRGEAGKANIQNECNFSQTMLRVKDPKKSIAFYEKLGMKLLETKEKEDFTLYFMASSSTTTAGNDDERPCDMFEPCLELTHNHGTETQDDFQHYSGNEDGRKGFGHIGFLVDDVYKACDGLRPLGYGFHKEPDGGSMKGLAFALDPDGYWIEIIKRGGIEYGDVKKE